MSTTPVSGHTHVAKRLVLGATVVLFLVASLVQMSPIARADDYDRRIAEIQGQINAYQAEAGKFSEKAQTLQAELDALVNQKNIIQSQIDLKQAEHDKLVAQIAENEKKIGENQDALGTTIADLYVSSDISSLEMLASSSNISEYVDKESYRNAIRDTLTATIADTKKRKKELEVQQQEVTRVMAELRFARDELAAKEAQQANLVAQTRGEEAAYRKLVGEREGQKLALQREQQAAIEAAMRRNGGLVNVLPGDPNKGGYPWEAGCWVDANAWSHGGAGGNGTDPLGYGCRQCVSYTGWKVGERTGNFPRYWGNANMWPASARAAGYQTGSTPRANSVGVISAGTYGHVVWVEDVHGDGTVTVSQYNYYNAGGPGWGHYSKMRVSAWTYDTYIYF